MHFLYNIGIYLLGIVIHVSAIFNEKTAKWVSGRKNLFSSFPEIGNSEVIWFHCASLGEFDQGLPLMNKIKEKNPSVFLLVTFFSPSGFEHYHKREHKVDFATYLPLDTPKNAKKFIAYFKPEKVFFIKYEFWSNFILEAKKQNSQIYNVSGIFREKHRFFKWYGSFFRFTLAQFDAFFVQNESSRKLLNTIGITKIQVVGDCRFDRVIENKQAWKENKLIHTFKNNEALFIIGSSWPEDEKLLIPWINEREGKVLIAPHDIGEDHIREIASKITVPLVRYSQASTESISEAQVLILDTIGLLSSAYSYGNAAYIGGGFSGSLHNILEPAVFGLPVIFGPLHSRFPEAQRFIDIGIGFSINRKSEFEKMYLKIITNLESIAALTKEFVKQNKGATDKIYSQVFH